MKNSFLLILILLISLTSFSQVTNKIQADSVKIYQVGGHSAELILENSTKGNTGGFLQNVYNGRTKFAMVLDSAWLNSGSLYFRRGASTLSFAIRNGIDSIVVRNDSLLEYRDGIGVFKGVTASGAVAGKLNISDTLSMLSPYLRKSDTTNKWLRSLNATISGALGVSGVPITAPSGTMAFTWQGLASQYVKGNGALSTFSTDVQSVGDARYALISHSHLSTDISDFTTASRNLFSGGTGISYNPSTGVIAWTGSASGITSVNGLTGTSQTFATGTSGSDFNIASAGTAHTFNIPTASASNRGALSSSDWSTFNNKEAGFTETTQEFTGSTSLTLTLSNTLKTSKAVVVYYNGLAMDNAAFSASGTTVTLSGLTRETSDKIKVKYSY